MAANAEPNAIAGRVRLVLRRLFPRSTPLLPVRSGSPPDRDGEGVSVSINELLRLRAEARDLGLSPRQKVHSLQAGGYVSPYRGRGVDFEEVRAYLPGDDIRNVDWRVTARSGHPHTKLFREERERPVLLFADQGPSMQFGTRGAFKSVRAAQTVALVAWAAVDNGDRVGGVIASAVTHAEVRPAAREHGALAFLRTLGAVHAAGLGSRAAGRFRLTPALDRLTRIARPGTLVFLVSDFRGLDREGEKRLVRLSRYNDLVAVFVYDPLEAQAPPPGRYRISDGARFATLDTAGRDFPALYARCFQARLEHLRTFFRGQGIHFQSLATDESLVSSLRRGLHARRAGPARSASLSVAP
jgi:uncharacterized protein (DUF58 family)